MSEDEHRHIHLILKPFDTSSAHRRLGTRVTRVVGTDQLTPHEGPELVVGSIDGVDVRGYMMINRRWRNPAIGRWYEVVDVDLAL